MEVHKEEMELGVEERLKTETLRAGRIRARHPALDFHGLCKEQCQDSMDVHCATGVSRSLTSQ